jgi:ATP-dependent Clp protease ATP-binding subunit ClpA
MDAMALAQEAGAHHIGTDHLVLAMIADDEQPMGRALASVGVPIEQIRSEVRSAVGISETPSQGQIPFAADSKKALELALREAIRAGDKRIRSRHILLGLLRDPKSHGANILVTHGVTHAAVEGWLGPDSGLE